MTNPPTLARGASLTAATWEDFRRRLEHDCIGPGVDRHHTADPVFCVQSKAYVYGLEDLHGGTQVVCSADGESVHENPLDFYNHALDEEEQASLDQTALEAHGERFVDIHLREQWRLIGDLKNVNVTNRAEHWRHVCCHFTREAAEAFIARKGHDYRDGLRIYVEAQPYCWEFNAIREAIIDGRLLLADQLTDEQRQLVELRSLLAEASHALKGGSVASEAMINRIEGALKSSPTTAKRKLGDLTEQGFEPCGLMIQRVEDDGTVKRGAVSDAGMVIWWHPNQFNESPLAQWFAGWLVTDSGGKEVFQSDGGPIGGMTYKGGAPLALMAQFEPSHSDQLFTSKDREPGAELIWPKAREVGPLDEGGETGGSK